MWIVRALASGVGVGCIVFAVVFVGKELGFTKPNHFFALHILGQCVGVLLMLLVTLGLEEKRKKKE